MVRAGPPCSGGPTENTLPGRGGAVAALSERRRGALKGALLALGATALASSVAGAWYARRGWVVPSQQQGFYQLFLDTVLTLGPANQPDGTIALLCSAGVAAMV